MTKHCCWGVISLVTAVFFNACCKEGCVEKYMRTVFIGFDSTEVDTIDTRLYMPGSNFTQTIDSHRVVYLQALGIPCDLL
jgi:hypothetical protein